MDSREVEVIGIILGLQLKLAAYPQITFQMDILVIDVPDAWECFCQESGELHWREIFKWIFLMQPSRFLTTPL